MRQPACILRLSFGVALFHCVVGSAQEPSDPKALMRTASKINNLVAPDAKPWHIKASFQLFDEQGAVSDEGNYEEFWSSPTKFKRILTGKTFLLTNYGSAKGILRGESKGETPDFAFDTHRDFVNPLPAAEMIDHSSYSSKPVKSGDMQLT